MRIIQAMNGNILEILAQATQEASESTTCADNVAPFSKASELLQDAARLAEGLRDDPSMEGWHALEGKYSLEYFSEGEKLRRGINFTPASAPFTAYATDDPARYKVRESLHQTPNLKSKLEHEELIMFIGQEAESDSPIGRITPAIALRSREGYEQPERYRGDGMVVVYDPTRYKFVEAEFRSESYQPAPGGREFQTRDLMAVGVPFFLHVTGRPLDLVEPTNELLEDNMLLAVGENIIGDSTAPPSLDTYYLPAVRLQTVDITVPDFGLLHH